MSFRSNLANDRQPAPSFLSQHTAHQVEQAVQRWERQIRQLMAQVTGLRLPSDRTFRIDVQGNEGIPPPLVERIERHYREINSPNIEDLFPSYDVKDLMGPLELEGLSFTGSGANQPHTFSEHNDVLGAYFPERQAIELYWVLIGMFAAALKCSVKDLTCVVLTHELAHAFTHLGQDLDGHHWDTIQFANAEVTTMEGLAQFYTELAVKKMPRSSRRISHVFNALLQFQPEPYHKHREWIAQGGQNINEEIRRRMLACRYLGTHGNLFDNV